ncbi:uncharacterized protein CcaverHIS019_0201900 [Cutaneotrichosporon cavernicola]|uniref:EXS-domain-containing protein n=1 Tax=Cutaneotrichosporon cavernicola TaxID=279322 RepID=A0AA48IF16_9TREE|nr:uncharacterized protein CcaverHIS019_0201900 [Cutaneotrichosporon cavernicola]BEI88828.1 hypothetical protein CcaverHIS019_0201900 [Cutaneotrichosporon cavernicola]BEI96603.1 hypothetical protein CcaverHIS631_0201920 [Cutaneotrichosporon cavernicola]
MKFGSYLADNATPEWARAYIDYRALKKQIKRIVARMHDEGEDVDDRSSDDEDHGPSRRAVDTSGRTQIGTARPTPERTSSYRSGRSSASAVGVRPAVTNPSAVRSPLSSTEVHQSTPATPLTSDRPSPSYATIAANAVRTVSDDGSSNASGADADVEGEGETEGESQPVPANADTGQPSDSWKWKRRGSVLIAGLSPKLSLIPGRAQASVGLSPANTQDAPSGNRSIRSLRLPSPKLQARSYRTFEELYDTLEPDEKAFFDLLDQQLEKVEDFYSARETEATRRFHQLSDQLTELAEHRRIFHEQYPEGVPEWEAKMGRALQIPGYDEFWPSRIAQKLHLRQPSMLKGNSRRNSTNSRATVVPFPLTGLTTPSGSGSDVGAGSANGARVTKLPRQYNPERYLKYKKDLRNAMFEFYRQLELLKNYRILNLTGFRKALKKFEKATRIQCLELYTEDRIGPCSFARGETIDSLIRQTEELFTKHFEHGDAKRARLKLREGDQPMTHYLTVFRSAMMMGLGLPAMVLAIVKVFDEHTREEIPEWGALLQLYSGLFIPVFFGLLFELNLTAWVEARINYEFVMELNRPTLDYRSFMEIPSFLFMTLSYCLFFSFYQIARGSVAVTTWPLAWTVFTCAFFLNPLPIFRRRVRWWFLRVLFRVCTPGYSRVEFIAFFVADELNSLVYTLQNFMFMGCVYAKHWPGDQTFHVCKTGQSWPYALLAVLPPLSRLIQCLKRYHDSGLYIHLINGGKYCSSILTACLFVYWRSQAKPLEGAPFIVWVIFATVSSAYTSIWDLVVDWSLLRPGCRGLRRDLGYSSHSFYYFAMVSNVLIRFIWIWYIPHHANLTKLRSFIFAMFEMLRRWQWNFFRVETEHLGNADAYRVTREIPLPYRSTKRSDSDDEYSSVKSSMKTTPLMAKLRHIRTTIVGEHAAGRGLDALNVGARGHAAQREYEARRPGDFVRSSGSARPAAVQRSVSRRTNASDDSNV